MGMISNKIWSNQILIAMLVFFVLTMLCSVVTCKHVHICGRSNHNGSSGELLPHNGVIPAGHDCTWHIYPENFNIPEVYMVVEDFQLDPSDRFIVSKHDGDRLFGPLNGTRGTFTILTGYLMLDVEVKIEKSPTKDRHFKTYFTTNDCYYLIEDESGTMASPLYNDVAHRKNITCEWRFRKFKQVTLPRTVIFSTFHLTNSTLTVKGSKSQDGIYTGTKLPQNIIAYGETQFVLRLTTTVPGETFSFHYGLNALNSPSSESELVGLNGHSAQVSQSKPTLTKNNGACGNINLRGRNGEFYPKDSTMTANHQCQWTIQRGILQDSPGIFIVVEEADLLSDDFFVLKPWQSLSEAKVLFGPYYGKIGLFSIFTDETKVEASLTTSNSELYMKRTFRGYYSTAGCNYQITNYFGAIHSPFYKPKEQKKTACSWEFKHDDTSLIMSVSFEKYNIKTSQLQIEGSLNQDQMYKASDGPFDILMKQNGKLTLEIDRTMENETISFSYNTVTPECSKYIKIIGKESAPLEFPPAGSHNDDSFNCQWIIESEKKGVLAVYFEDIHLADAEDLLLIKDGKTRASPKLIQVTENSQENLKGSYLVSTSNVIWISFSTHYPFKGSQFKLSVNVSEQGGHLHGGQDFTIVPPESGVDVIFYLEVEKDEQVLLNLLPNQKLPSNGIISVYNGLTVNSPLLTKLKHDKAFYPVASTESKMMLVAKGFEKSSSVKLRFKGIPKGCHQVTLDQHGTYSLSGNCNNTCSWAILPTSSDNEEMLSLHLSSVTLRPDDVIEVRQLDDDLTLLDIITLNENHMPNLYLPASYGAYIHITRGTCFANNEKSTAFSASAEMLRGCSVNIEVDAGEKVSLRSPNYPDTYPFNSHCYWNVSTKAKNLYLSFENFQLASGHCLKVHELDNGHILDTLTFDSSLVPTDKMLTNDIAFELVASPCVHINTTASSKPSKGNGFLVEVFALDCGGVLGKEMKGTFSTPGFPEQVTESLLCIWNVQVPSHNSDGSVNVISFDIQWSSPSTDQETGLTIHDGPSLLSQILTNETTIANLLSKTNTLIFVYEQNDTSKSHAALKVDFESRAGNSLCDNGIYMHPDWVCNSIDECGDYSDEKNCKGRAPLPPPVPPLPPNINITKSGVSHVVFWSVVPTAFLVGIFATLSTAFVIKEVKRRREESYDTLPILP